jgi:hypothetical protein
MSEMNPYQPPPSRSIVAPIDGSFIPHGRAVDAARGWEWIANGFELFKQQAGMWILLVIVFAIVYILIGVVPVLGTIANALLLPVFGAGFMLACEARSRGEAVEVGHLFAGFKRNTGDLVMLGVLSLIAGVVILLPAMALIGGAGFMAVMHGGYYGLAAMGLTAVMALLTVLALSVPLCMALWFAPALVIFQKLKPVDALKHSFFGCLKNIVPFLIYSIIVLVLGVIAAIPFGLGYLVWVPVVVASVYAGYRDIFAPA